MLPRNMLTKFKPKMDPANVLVGAGGVNLGVRRALSLAE